MWRPSIFVWLFSILVSIQGFGFRGFHYEGLEEPVVKGGRILKEKWVEQPLDHFDVTNNRTWRMRYYENDQFFNKTGPIFVMLGGEWTITPGYLQTGILFENAEVHGAMMYYTEHRYYGKSRPVVDTSAENLQFLSVDQALADVVFFIDTTKQKLNISESPVIVFGGSYAGNMAAWARIKYPHLISGAVASSAPVRAKADFYEYYEVVRNSLNIYNEKCATDTKAAFSVIEKLLTGKTADPKKFKDDFNLCDVPDISKSTELAWVTRSLAEMFASTVQYNSVEWDGKTSIVKLCDLMMAPSGNASSPYDRLANMFKSRNNRKCVNLKYSDFINSYRNTSWESEAASSNMRQWTYQTCTEYGYYQTSNSPKSIFGTLFPIDSDIQMCKDLYGEYYNEGIVKKSVRRTNIMYGADLPDVDRIIFTNGDVDPWHALSVLKDINKEASAIFIKGSSHCADLKSEKSTDIEGLKEARYIIASKISNWLNSTHSNY
ncbi:thymus-specific serine protease [Diachasma alloeum]|uniref:thymus-specific serine protease n=1 Tax=Diachasma alloeum TaxID=454923 RepID=UPI0007382F1E|nr:thymus-specific serine protease [Diachasma alloeum]